MLINCSSLLFVSSLLTLGIAPVFGAATDGPLKSLSFNNDIRPILAENCFHCHGQDESKREAELRLDSFNGATRDLDGYAALVPGKPNESELYLLVTSEDEDEFMPPPDSNRSLTDEQKETLRLWIEQGGEYDTHWAFIAPEKQPLGQSTNHPIDHFVSSRLSDESLSFSPAASPATWLRRVSFDLTGLPPTAQALDTFVKAAALQGDSAYANKTDELLASPSYGERMASDWLDAARYADTHGFNNDSARSMWRWRDWVIDAFNQNLPYDQFITEQLAGDLLPNPTIEQRIATGFSRNHGINSEGGIIDEEYRVEYVADRVRTVGMAWMGLTTECARCHDHKYDPFTQEDYYRLFAFFNNVNEFGEDGRVANAVPMMPSPTSEQGQALESLEAKFQSASQERSQFLAKQTMPSVNALAQAQARMSLPALPEPVWKISDPQETEASPLENTENPLSAPGIHGDALVASPRNGIGQVEKKANVFEEKTDAFAIAFWMRPESSSPKNAPLLSNARYESNPTSSDYGKGWDIRIVDGEIQFTIGNRYPAYSIMLRTRFAKIRPEQWRHIAVSFTGRTEADDAYTPASRFRIYIDGEENRLSVLHDGMQNMPKDRDQAILLGSDTFPDGNRFIGRLDELQQFGMALSPEQVARVFEADALDYAASISHSMELTSREENWAKIAVSNQGTDTRWKRIDSDYRNTRSKLLDLERAIPTTMVMQEREEMRDTFVLDRGSYDSPKNKVEPGVPEDWLAPWPQNAPRNRLGLAQWLTQANNPLTARVVVNRFWQQLFGTAIVKTSEDFGVQSEYPSHPKLLDWLAVDFMETGWDVKRLLKQIVLSQTYRQQSRIAPDLQTFDPENRLLARGPRFRLPAEAIRDQALAISGLLSPQIGGPSVRPYQPKNLYQGIVVGANYPSTKWVESEGADIYRRSLYTFWKRTVPHPLMTTFDAPSREVCSVRRSRTNTPLQALSTMNDPTFIEAARVLAGKLLAKHSLSPEARLAYAFRLATGRQPNANETSILSKALSDMLASFEAEPEEANALLSVGNSPVSGNHAPASLAAYTALMSLILNLDETLTKG